jgi:cardiolipin synthase C
MAAVQPFQQRSMRPAAYLTAFSRLNRRMHNKLFTEDNVAAIIGGRNVGDEYFGAAGDVEFADLDLLAVGEVVSEVAGLFDLYSNSELAYPVTNMVKPASRPVDAKGMLPHMVAAIGLSRSSRCGVAILRADEGRH